jgi:hypothetical protein
MASIASLIHAKRDLKDLKRAQQQKAKQQFDSPPPPMRMASGNDVEAAGPDQAVSGVQLVAK